MNYHQLAEHLYGLGFSILPLNDKVPTVKWKRLQRERCSRRELATWFRDTGWRPGIVTGELSGVVVVDCDNRSAAEAVVAAGYDSVTQQATKRGRHYVFRHPGNLTRNRRNVGGEKIDVRGDGGYVVAYEDSATWTADLLADAPTYHEPEIA